MSAHDPKRLLSPPSDATALERALLRQAVGTIDPPSGAEDAILATLLTRLPPPTTPPSGGATGSPTGAVGAKAVGLAGLAKGAGALVAVTTIAVGALSVGRGWDAGRAVPAGATSAAIVAASASSPVALQTAPPVDAPSTAVPGTSSETAEGRPTPLRASVADRANGRQSTTRASGAPHALAVPAATSATAVTPVTASKGSVAEPSSPGPAYPESTGSTATANIGGPPNASDTASARPLPPTALAEEAKLLADAQRSLQRGDASSALETLARARAAHPNGMLGQEREALTIEALFRSGQRATASAAAEAFMKAHPDSPLAARVRTLAGH
jgi:hypothetical protein